MITELQRDITFKQSQGHTRGGVLVKFAQDEIHLNGRRVGYVGHGPNEDANLIAPVDDETRLLIAEAIKAHRGTAPSQVNSAPPIPDEDESSDDE